jgi:regulator of replication initiation timing
LVEALSKEEKIKVLKALEEDVEFRYAVAGLLGLQEIIKRLDNIEEDIKYLWEEVKELRLGQNKLWEEVKELRLGQNKLWEEVKELRLGQNKLWEEVKALREGQNKLWENQNKLWENQNKLWEEVKALREGQNKLWEEVKGLRFNFTQLGRALGMGLEHYTAAFLEKYLIEKGWPKEKVDVKIDIKFMRKGEFLEVNLFNEEPLLVGEATAYLASIKEVEKEINKLLERIKIVQEIYGKKVDLPVLAVMNIEKKASKKLEEFSKKYNILIITGREIEAFAK